MTTAKLEFIKEYDLNEVQENYIHGLGWATFEQIEEVVNSLEEKVTFQTVLDYVATVTLHTFDFRTEDEVSSRVKNGFYTLLHMNITDNDINMSVDENNIITYTLTMPDEHYIIMSLLGTLDDMANYIADQAVADVFIVKNKNDIELYRA